MKRPNTDGPACPRCGYVIFGLRDMRCPECGRALDVRDFNISGASTPRDRRRYERTGAISGVVLSVILLAAIVPLGMLCCSMFGNGYLPIRLVMLIVVLIVCLCGVLDQAVRDGASYVKGSRKRR